MSTDLDPRLEGFDNAETELFQTLLGDLGQWLERARAAGASPTDALVCLMEQLGRTAAVALNDATPINLFLADVVNTVAKSYHAELRRIVAQRTAREDLAAQAEIYRAKGRRR